MSKGYTIITNSGDAAEDGLYYNGVQVANAWELDRQHRLSPTDLVGFSTGMLARIHDKTDRIRREKLAHLGMGR